jgi:glycosyltransferase involved in cell wall biosynthesis
VSAGTARPRVLVFAYACEPGRGSEPGAGWGIVRALATFADCTVLAGPEHTPRIAQLKASEADGRLAFVEVSEPGWGRLAKHHRTTWFLLYLEWLRRALRVARQLHAARPYHLVYHATYSAYWLPSPVARFDIPSVWGPVGGAVVSPFRLWPSLGPRGILGEILDLVAVRTLARFPATRRTWAAATIRIVQNEATLNRLPERLRAGTYVLNHAPFVEVQQLKRRSPRPEVLSLGALDSRKGVSLAIRGLVHTPEEVRLLVVGDGPRRRSLEALARKLKVADRVEFRGRVERSEVFRLLEEAAAAVFVGLREEGGIALAEAMLIGIPVIVLAHGGARTVALGALDPSRVALISPDRPATVARHVGDAMARFCRDSGTDAGPNLDPGRSLTLLEAVCREALGGPSVSTSPRHRPAISSQAR